MIWITINVNEIIKFNPIYFSQEHTSVCKKVCNVLHINCFPAVDDLAYYKLNGSEWSRVSFEYNIGKIDSAFDERILKYLASNDSNIIFTHENKLINGVIHFTDYESPYVYSTIYHNLNIFEKNLRSHLYENGLDDNDLLNYYETYKLKNERKKDRIIRLIDDLKKAVGKKPPFESSYLRELIDFSISGYHPKEVLSKLGTSFFKDKTENRENIGNTISSLRNLIMHHSNISGETVFSPHNFGEFKKFFDAVTSFQKGFNSLRQERLALKRHNIAISNNIRLEIIDKLRDQEVSNYFYN